MKKLMLSLAVVSLFAITGINAQTLPNEATDFTQETTKIDPETLPEKVKETIQNDETVKDLTISEAHQVMEEAEVYYMIKFESTNPGEELTKKYDAMGKEVKEEKAEEPVK
ncbi:hypothetical protein [Cyclobacterium jeungdonense]|uniref:PepSY domain-containing protein n=1 Tax=Cyclobacterium jeungdonense TaxID=708087 RepID=A0ABT8CET3_9BACT|nr:hypothetical protein [Cyclobacterium jeungdonense]MDN3690103.1 hypothetical protein [Cyclobacterium jeungdonense]